LDFRLLARALRRGIGLPLLRWISERKRRSAGYFVGLGAIGGVRPDLAAVLFLSINAGTTAPSWRDASVVVQVRIRPCQRSMAIWFL
jgi:hypothetical protein